jgi:hypothetical protein
MSAARGVVYFVRCTSTDLVKVGYASHMPSRLSELQTGSASELVLERTIAAVDRAEEKQLHARFAAKRVHREWFRLTREEVAAVGENVTAAERRLRGVIYDAVRDAYPIGDGFAYDVATVVVTSGILHMSKEDRRRFVEAVTDIAKSRARR